MAQSEEGYLRAQLELSSVEVARIMGMLARQAGASAAQNPFLDPASLPCRTGVGEQARFRRCDAWRRGWDAEDLRARNDRTSLPGWCDSLVAMGLDERGPEKSLLFASLARKERL